MKVLSLFDGIGGARQAFKELNIDCDYYASEIDKYAIQVAKANHSDIKHIGDAQGIMTEDGWLFYNQNNDPIKSGGSIEAKFDLLIGGSPCQDLSIAKKDRKGLEGDRSSLFYEYVRILKELKPKYFILENVYSMGKENAKIISKELFDVEPVMINSALLTAQNRKRLYWVGKLVDGEYKQIKIEQPKDQEIYLKDIVEENVDEKYYMNDNQVLNIKKSNYRDRKPMDINKKSNTLKIGGDKKRIIYKKKWRFLTPTECCRLQGFPDDYVSMVSKTQGYKGLGNSFTVPVIKHILQKILKS